MKILAVDIGTGTQDVYLYNSALDMENNLKLVLPSPTMIARQQIRKATRDGVPILLTGVTMGGGPSTWAVEDHLRVGLGVYATAEAARTFNDDLEEVTELGVVLVSEDEAEKLLAPVRCIHLGDLDFASITEVFRAFSTDLDDLDAIAVGVFDHGNAPQGVSDRKFRFDYLDQRIRQLNRLSAFGYRADEVPERMTRLQAVVESARGIEFPLVVMDTAPAAVLGASLDPVIAGEHQVVITNVGNFHTLAFRLGPGGIEGLFEHHTALVDRKKLEELLHSLANGTLENEAVFNHQGHGALIYDPTPLKLGRGDYDVVVTGPRRTIFRSESAPTNASYLRPYFAAPFGDMMITGCFGLLAAVADVMPELAGPIRTSLYDRDYRGAAPWEFD